MTYDALIDRRLSNQCLFGSQHRTAVDLVGWFGAVQAQEYLPAKWGLAQRLGNVADASIERALTDGRILRTHVLRPTWHFVRAADIRWMLGLTAPRVHRAMASYRRDLGLDAAAFRRATALFERVLENQSLTRNELRAALARAGMVATAAQMSHLCMYAELEAIICSGPRDGKSATYALVANRAPNSIRLERDAAIAELAKRYFRSHGPATIADFVWWSGLTVADVKRGLEMNRAQSITIDGKSYWTIGAARLSGSARGTLHLLPIYDEYLVAYRDRVAVPHALSTVAGANAAVTFQHAIIVNGRVAGTWRTSSSRSGVTITLVPLCSFNARQRRLIAEAVSRATRFLQRRKRRVAHAGGAS